MSVRVEFRWSEELLARVDAAASFESRASWVRRAVERALVTEPRGSEDARVSYAEPPAPAEQPENQYVSVYDHDENAELPPPLERRVSPSKPVSPRVPFRRDVKPFQRGDK